MEAIESEYFHILDKFEPHLICRLCLRSSCISRNAFESMQQIELCTGVRIESETHSPIGLCDECHSELHRAYNFRTRCLHTERILERLKIERDSRKTLQIKDKLKDTEPPPPPPTEEFKRDEPLSNNKTHNNHKRKMHSCTECPYATPYSQSLVYHLRVHTGERPYKCLVCSKSFTQPGSLKLHAKTHSDATYYTCDICGRQFKYKDSYETHKNVHVELATYTCKVCNKSLKTQRTLTGHMNRHYNVKDFNCETCGALFVTRVELWNHAKTHQTFDSKRYACDMCDYRTCRKKGLAAHLRRHTGERPFKCDSCPVACYTRGELKCHERRHNKERNYSCPVCQATFVHSSSVNKHTLRRHGVKYNRAGVVDRRVVK